MKIDNAALLEWILLFSFSVQSAAKGPYESRSKHVVRVSGIARAFLAAESVTSSIDTPVDMRMSELQSTCISSIQQKDSSIIPVFSISRGGANDENLWNFPLVQVKRRRPANPYYRDQSHGPNTDLLPTPNDFSDNDDGDNDDSLHVVSNKSYDMHPASRTSRKIQNHSQVRMREAPPLPRSEWEEDSESQLSQEEASEEDIPSRLTNPLHQIADSDANGAESETLSGHFYQKDESQQEEKFPHSPIVYRYFGRSRTRTYSSDSVSFIFLGPSVDHLKEAGEVLASRGFNVMACERIEEQDEDITHRSPSEPTTRAEEGHNLVLSLLDALKWNKAIIVGCDNESAIAIEAALRLAPEKIAGLVLCGDLSSADQAVSHLQSLDPDHRQGRVARPFSTDAFLRDNLNCPFTIIWDGDMPANKESNEILGNNRRLIMGGGSAPHRRLPEQFAWSLTRFVEEQVESHQSNVPTATPIVGVYSNGEAPTKTNNDRIKFPFDLPFGLDELLKPGSLLVTGRVVATVIFYASCMNVAVHQYGNIRSGMMGFKTGWRTIASWRTNLAGLVTGFAKAVGAFFGIFSQTNTLPEDSDTSPPIESTVVELDEPQEGGEKDGDAEVFQEDEDVEALQEGGGGVGDGDRNGDVEVPQEGEDEDGKDPQEKMREDNSSDLTPSAPIDDYDNFEDSPPPYDYDSTPFDSYSEQLRIGYLDRIII